MRENDPFVPANGMVDLPASRKYDGKTMQVLYCADGKVAFLEGTVENGMVKVPFIGNGSFGLVVRLTDAGVTPQTGDSMPIALLGNSCMIALAGALMLLANKRKESI